MAKIKKFLVPLIILIFSLWQLNSFLDKRWPTSHDGIFHVIRIREFFYELKNGQFPVRWTGRLDNGYGIPLFNYVYPGPYLLSSIPMSLGISATDSYKIIMFFAYFVGIIGFYYLFRKNNRLLAIVSALIYGLTPYVFLNIFVRGALGEVVAMGFMPWVIYSFQSHKKILTVLSLSLVLISHNFLGILFLFFVILYLLWNKLFNKSVLINILISFGISAFFLLPMILERQFIVSGANNSFTFNYQEHFLYPQQLLYGKWDYWYSNPGPVDGMSFQLGFAGILILIISVFTLIIQRKITGLLFLTAIFIGSCILTQQFSLPLWKIIKPLQIVQFPWRFLFMTTILSPLLFFENIKYWIGGKPVMTTVLSLSIVLLALYNVRNYRRPMDFQSPEKYSIALNVYTNKTTTAAREEVSPKWALKEKFGADLSNNLTVDSPSDSPFTIHKNYFPTQKLINLSDNKVVPIKPDTDGNITANLPEGNYLLKNSSTVVELIANYVSLISLFVLFTPSLLRLARK